MSKTERSWCSTKELSEMLQILILPVHAVGRVSRVGMAERGAWVDGDW